MNHLTRLSFSASSLSDKNAPCVRAIADICVNLGISRRKARLARVIAFAVSLLSCVGTVSSWAYAQAPSMTVGTPTVDGNGVKYYPVTSVYQGSEQQIIRVLEPTNPAPGKPRRFLYVLPVDQGVQDLTSTWSDGLEELRLLDIPNRFNMTLIAPSFNYEPWYGDSVTDPTHRMESFIIVHLIPFGDTFAQGGVPQRYLIGFSKSGNGALDLILKHPRVFNAAAAWDSPAQLNDLSAFSALALNFGTQENFNLYYIPNLISSNATAFQQQNRLWVSGDQAAWTADMIALDSELSAASIPHTWVQGGVRVHSWNSGWLDGAVTNLDANATLTVPPGGTVAPGRSGGYPAGVLASGTSQTNISLTTDESATCRYATTAGVTFAAMTSTFSATGGTAQSTVVTGLADGGSYSYYVRCQDAAGNINPDDYAISFSVATSGGGGGGGTDPASSSFSGIEDPLTENGMWDEPGSWSSLKKNNGAYTTNTTSAARLATPVIAADQYVEITYDQDPGTASWPGVMTRVQGRTNGSGYLAIAYAGEVRLYRTDDTGSLNFSLLASAGAAVGTAPRRLRLESQGTTHRVYYNGVQMLSYTDSQYTTGQPAIADAIFGGPTIKILSFVGGSLAQKTSTTTAISSSSNPSIFGQSVTLTATVAAQGSGTPTGTVTFSNGTTTLGTSTLTGGTASLTISTLAAGTNSITATYSGDANFSGSSSSLNQTVSQASTTLAIGSSVNPSGVGQSVTLTATVAASNGSQVTGTITFQDGSTTLGTASISGNAASLTTSSLAAGTHSISSAYGGNSNFTGSNSNTVSQVVNKATTTTTLASSTNPSVSGTAVTFTAAVSSPAGAPTGSVQFLNGSTLLATVTIASGSAKYTTSTLAPGANSMTAVYLGDSRNNGSTSSTVNQFVIATTTTALTSSVNPSAYGQSITFTATVTSSIGAPPNGENVTFKQGSTVLGTGALSGGVATFSTSALTVGTKSVTAAYAGDTSFAASTSSAVSQVVNKASTTASLVSSLNPSVSGQNVTFTVTVAPQYSGTPTGSVVFKDGTTTLKTVSLSGGSASYSTTKLTRGSHTITVTYNGDTNFKTSSAAGLTQRVN